MSNKVVTFASDHAAKDCRERLIEYITSLGYTVNDHGAVGDISVDYPDYAKKACADVTHSGAIGILVCGTGIGMSITANKIKGIRAALCTNVFMAEATRAHNNANVLCMGARVNTLEEMKEIVSTFLCTEFEGGRHQVRVSKIES